MQLLLPPWVRARGLAFYLVVFMGGQAFGALAWGLLAARTSLTAALLTAGGLLLAGTMTLRWLPLRDNADFDRTLSSTWPDPVLALEPRPADGPVQIMIDYRVAAADQASFAEAMRLVELSRRRTGAISWGLFQDTTEADRFTETFLVSSWSEHLAQHHTRYTGHDHDIEEAARTFTTQPPEVRHGLPPQTELPPAGGVPATE
ncbi:MFS transporter [Streptacidiphilus sp. PAMC 29251]